eukprot:2962776-Amphidinium_carterae.1
MSKRAASVVGAATTAKKMKKTETGMVESLAAGFQAIGEKAVNQDLDYINAQLKGEDSDLVGKIADLLRSGTFRKALELKPAEDPETTLGKELASTADSLRGLREHYLLQLLQAFEPGVFTEEKIAGCAGKGKQMWLNMVTFALCARQSSKLPNEHPVFRYERPLLLYLKATGSHQIAALGEANDWRWDHQWSSEAVYKSASLGVILQPLGIFKKAGIDLGDTEPRKHFVLDEAVWPAALREFMSDESAGSLPTAQPNGSTAAAGTVAAASAPTTSGVVAVAPPS